MARLTIIPTNVTDMDVPDAVTNTDLFLVLQSGHLKQYHTVQN